MTNTNSNTNSIIIIILKLLYYSLPESINLIIYQFSIPPLPAYFILLLLLPLAISYLYPLLRKKQPSFSCPLLSKKEISPLLFGIFPFHFLKPFNSPINSSLLLFLHLHPLLLPSMLHLEFDRNRRKTPASPSVLEFTVAINR